MTADPRPRARSLGWALLAGLVAVAVQHAWRKGMAGEPEWAYHRLAASLRFEGGLSVHNPGYLPGFSALMRPFFLLPEGLGLALFIALGLLATGLCFHLLWRECARLSEHMPDRPGPWHWIWFAAPMYLGLQNNQVMAQMMCLAVIGLVLIERDAWVRGVAALSLSVTLKTFPIALGLYFLLKRRWRDALALGVGAALTTLLLGSLVYGFSQSLELHLSWPARAGGQEPANVLSGEAPRYFGDNQSVAAWLVRSAALVGNGPALVLRQAAFWGSLLLTAWAIVRRGGWRTRPGWDELALWFAWIVFASPFGRYYYAIMLLPAWLRLAWPGVPRRPGVPTLLHGLACLLPVLTWVSRGQGIYAVVCALTFGLCLRQVWTRRS